MKASPWIAFGSGTVGGSFCSREWAGAPIVLGSVIAWLPMILVPNDLGTGQYRGLFMYGTG